MLPAGVIKTVCYEEVVEDLPQMAREVIEFLDLPWNEACLNFHESVASRENGKCRAGEKTGLWQLGRAVAPA